MYAVIGFDRQKIKLYKANYVDWWKVKKHKLANKCKQKHTMCAE